MVALYDFQESLSTMRQSGNYGTDHCFDHWTLCSLDSELNSELAAASGVSFALVPRKCGLIHVTSCSRCAAQYRRRHPLRYSRRSPSSWPRRRLPWSHQSHDASSCFPSLLRSDYLSASSDWCPWTSFSLDQGCWSGSSSCGTWRLGVCLHDSTSISVCWWLKLVDRGLSSTSYGCYSGYGVFD